MYCRIYCLRRAFLYLIRTELKSFREMSVNDWISKMRETDIDLF
jgi:hypothetical protein